MFFCSESDEVILYYTGVSDKYIIPNKINCYRKININIAVFESEFPCFITTEEECYKESKKQGFELGSSATNDPFASTSHSTKGCYGYSSGKYAMKAFFGLGGSLEDCVSDASSYTLYKQCLAAGTTFLPFQFQN